MVVKKGAICVNLQSLISIIIAIITFFSSFSGLFSSGSGYTVKVEAPELVGYDWQCVIDDEKVMKLKGSSEAQGAAGSECREFTFAAVSYNYGCARARLTYTNGSVAAISYVYTFKTNGIPLLSRFSLLLEEEYPSGVPVSKSAAEILSAYTTVMNKAKLDVKTYKKTVYTDVDWLITAKETGASFKPGTNAFEDDGTFSSTAQFPISLSVGCALTDASKIKASSYEQLSDGKVRIIISLFDEREGERYIHKMFNVPNSAFFEMPSIAGPFNIQNAECNYFDCTAILVFEPQTNRIVSLEHIIGYGINGDVEYSGLACSIQGRPVDHERYDGFTF